ncbi:hypothetical protein [Pantoea stewartii]|uniref:hypothetical protein n=1 Tax=Pantoea stewartii TaxID=66269 RepID=UPI001981652A|nr:hypothetical protein [Pantoea stewartii]
MLDTSIYHTSETTTGVSCSPTNLVTLRDRNNKTWMIQKELIAWVREEEFSKGCRVVLSNDKWFDIPLSIDELVSALGLPVPPHTDD